MRKYRTHGDYAFVLGEFFLVSEADKHLQHTKFRDKAVSGLSRGHKEFSLRQHLVSTYNVWVGLPGTLAED